jgi:hypothetical protein
VEGIGGMIGNIMAKFQIDRRGDSAWACMKVRFYE